MKKNMFIQFSRSEAMQIIESLDHEKERYIKAAGEADNEDVVLDYEHDIVRIKELIVRFQDEAKKSFGDDIVDLAHFPRGISM